jgi:hypothetical protein
MGVSICEMQPDFSQFGPYLVAALVVFGIYRRFRRSFGRQPLRRGRMTLRIVLLAIVACALLPLALRSVQFLTAELVGAVLGVGLGLWGAERTRLVMFRDRLHYVPHTYTGIAVSLLFLGRVVFRLVQVYTTLHAAHAAQASAVNAADPANSFAPPGMVRSPLTVGIFFVLMGYYVCYYGLVLWKSKRLNAADIEVVPAATTP